MSASREFKNLQTTPLARGSRTRGGFLASFIQAGKAAEMARPPLLPCRLALLQLSPPCPFVERWIWMKRVKGKTFPWKRRCFLKMRKTARERLDDGNAEDAHKQKQKRKAHAKKKRSIGHWLHKSGKCLLCTYKQEDWRVDALIRHWQAKHFTQLKAA
jgi:hypothetical protein